MDQADYSEAVEKVARAIQHNYAGTETGWPIRKSAANAALDAISYDELLAELTTLRAVAYAAKGLLWYAEREAVSPAWARRLRHALSALPPQPGED